MYRFAFELFWYDEDLVSRLVEFEPRIDSSDVGNITERCIQLSFQCFDSFFPHLMGFIATFEGLSPAIFVASLFLFVFEETMGMSDPTK